MDMWDYNWHAIIYYQLYTVTILQSRDKHSTKLYIYITGSIYAVSTLYEALYANLGSPGKNSTFWKSIQRRLILIFIHSYYRFIASGYWIPSFVLQGLLHQTITGYHAVTSLKILPSLEMIHLNNAYLNSSQSCMRLITRQRLVMPLRLSSSRVRNSIKSCTRFQVSCQPLDLAKPWWRDYSGGNLISIYMFWCLTHPFICNDSNANLHAWMFMWLATSEREVWHIGTSFNYIYIINAVLCIMCPWIYFR